MSAVPSTVPSAIAKKTNASKWPLFRDILGSLNESRFQVTVDRLNTYLDNRRAYYQDARPEIVAVLESAAHAFEKLVKVPMSTSMEESDASEICDTLPGGVPCPPQYTLALRSFRKTVQTVYGHLDEFKKASDSEMDKALIARLQPIFSAFIPDYNEPSAEQQDDSIPEVETLEAPSTLQAAAVIDPKPSLSSENSNSAPRGNQRIPMTPSRIISPSPSALMMPATSSPFGQSTTSTPAAHRHITPRDDTPEPTGGITVDSPNDVEVIVYATSAPTASPNITSASLEHAAIEIDDVEMSDTKALDEHVDDLPTETSDMQKPDEVNAHEHSPVVDATPTEPSQTFEAIDHGSVQPEEARNVSPIEPIAPTVEEDPLFGTGYRVLCFERGRPTSSVFTMDAGDVAYGPIQLWQDIKDGKRELSSISDSRCLSFVIYDAEKVGVHQNGQPDASIASWFKSTSCISAGDINLYHLSVTMHDHRLEFPVFYARQEHPFVDLSAFAKDGGNPLQLSHSGDFSSYIFALVLHRPTAAQEARVRQKYAATQEWFAQ
ncbi:hypothetical protein PENSPDRAFT_656968 [Peniophora sp. CONT]|nr:hypothetical protein PENSPDRAFT_656968 [Peniophora sp. CONT]